jgi:hypothetical protein
MKSARSRFGVVYTVISDCSDPLSRSVMNYGCVAPSCVLGCDNVLILCVQCLRTAIRHEVYMERLCCTIIDP